jgi:hypothetical protein
MNWSNFPIVRIYYFVGFKSILLFCCPLCVYNIAQNFHTNEHDELPTYLELLVATFVYYNFSSMSASTNILACFLSPKLDASMFPMLPCNRDMIHNYQILASKFVHIKMLPILSCRTHLKKNEVIISSKQLCFLCKFISSVLHIRLWSFYVVIVLSRFHSIDASEASVFLYDILHR